MKEKELGIDLEKLKRPSPKPWRLRIKINGRRKNFYFKTEKLGRAFFEEHHAKRSYRYKNGVSGDEYYSVGYAVQKWIEEKTKEVKASTVNQFKRGAMNLIPIKNLWLHEITKEDIESCLDYSKGMKSGRNYFVFHCLDKANKLTQREIGLSNILDFEDLKFKHKWRTGIRTQVRQYHNLDEVKQISNYFLKEGEKNKNSNLMYHIHRIGVLTGARVGEICSFKRKNFYEAEKKLLIDSTLTKDLNNKTVDGADTKTGASRIINLPDEAIESIKFLLSYHAGKYILPPLSKRKEFCLPSTINANLKRACEVLGLFHIGTHGAFRKTFATNLYLSTDKNDRDIIAVIQKHLGHASPEMTLKYIQAVNTEIKDDLKRLGSFMAS